MSNHQDPYVVIESYMKRKYGDDFYNKQDFDHQLWHSYLSIHADREGGKSKKKDKLKNKDPFESFAELKKLSDLLKEDEDEENYFVKMKKNIDKEVAVFKKRLEMANSQYNFIKKKYKLEKDNLDPNEIVKFKDAFNKLNNRILELKLNIRNLKDSKDRLAKEQELLNKEERKYEKRIKPIREKQEKEIEQEDELRSALSRLRLV